MAKDNYLNQGDAVNMGYGLILKQEGIAPNCYVLVQNNGKSIGIINGRLKYIPEDITHRIYLTLLDTEVAIAVF